MDVKNYGTICFGIGHNLSLICQLTSEDIKHHFIIIIRRQIGAPPGVGDGGDCKGTAEMPGGGRGGGAQRRPGRGGGAIGGQRCVCGEGEGSVVGRGTRGGGGVRKGGRQCSGKMDTGGGGGGGRGGKAV